MPTKAHKSYSGGTIALQTADKTKLVLFSTVILLLCHPTF
eukprot:COSAG01_NODE_71836_length_254_cov_1.664516_1_plen_39_part_01